MTKKRALILAAAVAVALFTYEFLWPPGHAPRGQQPVVSLSKGNFAAFQQAFDEDPATPHLFLLLSPT